MQRKSNHPKYLDLVHVEVLGPSLDTDRHVSASGGWRACVGLDQRCGAALIPARGTLGEVRKVGGREGADSDREPCQASCAN